MHDTTLARTTDVEQVFPDRAPWNISDFTAEEIPRWTPEAGSATTSRASGAHPGAVPGRVDENGQKLLLELKAPELYPGIEQQTLGELSAEGWLDRKHPGAG